MSDLGHLRKSYERDTLEETQASSEPLKQFEQWMKEALASGVVPEPNAMTVATVSPEGGPPPASC
jgi:pyridoxamine 5'-phosphate oxidase